MRNFCSDAGVSRSKRAPFWFYCLSHVPQPQHDALGTTSTHRVPGRGFRVLGACFVARLQCPRTWNKVPRSVTSDAIPTGKTKGDTSVGRRFSYQETPASFPAWFLELAAPMCLSCVVVAPQSCSRREMEACPSCRDRGVDASTRDVALGLRVSDLQQPDGVTMRSFISAHAAASGLLVAAIRWGHGICRCG